MPDGRAACPIRRRSIPAGSAPKQPSIAAFNDYLVRPAEVRRVPEKRPCRSTTTCSTSSTRRLPGYEEVGRRRVLLGCWGSDNDPDTCDYTVRRHGRLGPADVRLARRRRRRQADHDRSRRHQPRHPHPPRQLVLRRLAGSGDLRSEGPARQPGRSPASVEPDDDPPAGETEPGAGGQVHMGDVTALARSPDGPDAGPRHGRRTSRALLGDGPRRSGGCRRRQGDGTFGQDPAAADGDAAGGRVRVEDPEVVERARTQPGSHLLPGVLGGNGAPLRRDGQEGDLRRPTGDGDRVRGARRRDRLRLP